MRAKSFGHGAAAVSLAFAMLLSSGVFYASEGDTGSLQNSAPLTQPQIQFSPSICTEICEPSESMAMPAFMLADELNNKKDTAQASSDDKITENEEIGEAAASSDPETLAGGDSTAKADGSEAAGEEKDPRKYDYSAPVPENDEVEDTYFKNALFIGDSRTVGMQNWSGVTAYYYCKVGLNIRGVLTNAFIEDNLSGDETVIRTIIDTIEKYPVFKKVYISFGLNELGWDENVFINTYSYVIEQIKSFLPKADIYVQAVIPVTADASKANKNGVNNDRIDKYNELLAQMACDEEVFFLAINDPFTDEDGCLTEESGDGIHLGAKSVKKQFDYFRTHTVTRSDYDWEK